MGWIILLAALSAVCCCGTVALAVWLIHRRSDRRIAAYQNKLLARQIIEVENLYTTMRGWRHDYHNHLQTLKARLDMGQTQGAREYLDTLEHDLDGIHALAETGNVSVDAILNAKLSLVLKQGINLNVKATVPKNLTVSDIDLCVILGNLIDNAMESCEKVDEDGRFLRLYINVLKQQLYITITNATAETIRKIDVAYISTKRGNHGHGLKRIDRVVKKYDGYINRKNEPGVFVTEILLPL
ncbi:sensor histidine kinase [Acutalibacter caecimuris]|uniref:sensor histidine kinase n=1 Tax=Acutalibacter caecimuris TaxID=3093657 RepID=UPI002AC9D49F|nr:GHKL domain-containing protein [Acutalibacter sp. M00118]